MIALSQIVRIEDVQGTLVRALLTREAINYALTNRARKLAELYKQLLNGNIEHYNHLTQQVEIQGNDQSLIEELPASSELPGHIRVLPGQEKVNLQGVGVAIFGDAVLIDSHGTGQLPESASKLDIKDKHAVCLTCKYFTAMDNTNEWGICQHPSIFNYEQQIVWGDIAACEADFGLHFSPIYDERSNEWLYKLGIIWLLAGIVVIPLDFGVILASLPELTVLWIFLGITWASTYLFREFSQWAKRKIKHKQTERRIKNTIESVQNQPAQKPSQKREEPYDE